MFPALSHAAPDRLASLVVTALAALLLSLSLNVAQAGTKEDIEADLRAGRYTQADQRLQSVRQKHPDNALAAYWHAQVLHKLARDDEARQALRQALQSDPTLRFAAQRKTLDTLAAQLGVPLPDSADSGTAAVPPLPVAQAAAPVERPAPLPAPAAERPIWPWALGLGFVGWLLWRWTRRRAAEARQDFARSTSGPHPYHQPTWQGQPATAPSGVSGLGAAAIGVGAALATGAVLAAMSQGRDDDEGPRHTGGDGGATPDFDLGGSGGDFDGGGGDFGGGGDGGGSFD